VVPGFHCAFHPDMPPSLTPGSSIVVPSRTPTSTLAFAMDQRARHSRCSRNPFRAGHGFRGYTGSLLLRPVRLLAPLYGSDPVSRPPGAFTSRLSTARSSLPSLDMTTAVTGLLVWGFFCQEVLARSFKKFQQEVSAERPIFLPSSVSLFDMKARFFVSDQKPSRAGAVKAGRLLATTRRAWR